MELLKSKLASGVMGAGGSTEKGEGSEATVAAPAQDGRGKVSTVSAAVMAQALRAKLAQMEAGIGD